MSNFHMEIVTVSRGKGNSLADRINYISGQRIRDDYLGKTYYEKREGAISCSIYLPEDAPQAYYDLQTLCSAMDTAETRYDGRTAREYKGSLPNELPCDVLQEIVEAYVQENFVSRGLAVIAALHENKHPTDPTRDNPHVHILVSTRAVDREGFGKHKLRELDQRDNINVWRENWAKVQNRAYRDHGLDIQVSHESLKARGIDREPTPYMSRIDWQREQQRARTKAEREERDIVKDDRERESLRTQEREKSRSIGRTR